MVLNAEEVKENQDALEDLLRYAGVPEKCIFCNIYCTNSL